MLFIALPASTCFEKLLGSLIICLFLFVVIIWLLRYSHFHLRNLRPKRICYPDPVPLAPLALEISFLTKIGGYPLDCSGRFSDMLCYLLLCCLGIGLHEFKQRLFFQSDIQRAILALWRICSVTLAHWNMQITIQEFVLCPEQQFDIIRVTVVSPLQIYKILPWFWKRVTAEIQEYLGIFIPQNIWQVRPRCLRRGGRAWGWCRPVRRALSAGCRGCRRGRSGFVVRW